MTARPHATRADAGESVDVRFTVNGTEVTLSVSARVTLADALRDQLALTGTHLGCEHGVCGMCTVLVDGQAARSCLLFACQLDGSTVVTVEGMGRPDDLHPLQEAFGRHHALQCGFCTPGFLLSAYDLLTSKPDVTDDELPEELSGVLCRCTGYRNIIAAVSDARRQHPDGLPPPKNCAEQITPARAPASVEHEQPSGPAPSSDAELPQGEPTVRVDVAAHIEAPIGKVWAVLDDIPLLAQCLPGAELTEDLGDQRYGGRARVAVGPIRLSFHGVARIVERDADTGTVRVIAAGNEAGGGRTQASIELVARPVDGGTELRVTADVFLTGRIAQFGRTLAGDISRRLFEQFAESLKHTALSGVPTTTTTPNAMRLLLATLIDRLRRVLRRRGNR